MNCCDQRMNSNHLNDMKMYGNLLSFISVILFVTALVMLILCRLSDIHIYLLRWSLVQLVLGTTKSNIFPIFFWILISVGSAVR